MRVARGATLIGVVLVAMIAACGSDAVAPPGTMIRVLASWTGDELNAFTSVLAPFEERTGFTVEYTATRDLRGALAAAIDADQPPDLAGIAGPEHMMELARAGALRDLAGAIDLRAYKRAVAPTFIDLGTVDGRLVGVFVRSTVKGLIWFDPSVLAGPPPASWSELELTAVAAPKAKPWCLGLASQEASGWPGTDWIEDFLIRQSGPDVYDAWAAGRLAWTSREVTRAWRSYGRVAADGAVFGGVRTALDTDFANAGDPLFTSPAGCLFMHQGSFMPAFWQEPGLVPGRDYDFFPFPEIEPEHRGAVVGAGDLFGLFTDNVAARQLLGYLVDREAQTLWTSMGGALSVHREVRAYPDAVAAKAADLLGQADVFRFDASDLMPADLNTAFWHGVLDYTADASQLPAILDRLEALRQRVYGQ